MTRFFQQVNALAPRWVQEQPREVRRFLKFAIVGTIGAVVDFGVLNVLILVFGVPKAYANLVSVTAAILSNFTWNRLWTFPESRERAVHTQFTQFLLVNLVGLLINQFVFLNTDHYLFEPVFGVDAPLAYNLAKACAIVVVLFWNFGANRFWTYRGIE